MRVAAVVMALALAGSSAAGPPVGDELWVIKNGTIVGKVSTQEAKEGAEVFVGDVKFTACFLRPEPAPPTLTPPPEFVVEPPAVEPEDVVEPAEETSEVDLVSILFYVVTAGLGWYIGRNQADDDENDNSLIDGAQRRALDTLVPVYQGEK